MKLIEELKQYNPREWAIFLIIIAGVVALGLFGLNQFLNYKYSSYLLSTPCDVCIQFNPELEKCIHPNGILDNLDSMGDIKATPTISYDAPIGPNLPINSS